MNNTLTRLIGTWYGALKNLKVHRDLALMRRVPSESVWLSNHLLLWATATYGYSRVVRPTTNILAQGDFSQELQVQLENIRSPGHSQ